MKLSTLVDVFIVALYNETLLHHDKEFTIRDILERYSLNIEPIWERRIAENAKMRSYAGVSGMADDIRDEPLSLSSAGFEWAEDNYGENIPSFLEANGAIYVGDGSSPVSSVDSAGWTGLPSEFKLTESRRLSLVALLSDAERELDSVGAVNSEKAMVRAYIIAARMLSEAPDPPVDLIWEMVRRANALAGIASLFVSIIALFTAAAH